MKILALLLLIMANLLALETRQILMDSITPYALRIGNGSTKVYTFIDPICPKSQIFIENILSRKDLQEENTYYVFLYELPKFHSHKYIIYIYQAKAPLEALQEIMVYNNYEVPISKSSPQTQLKIEHIRKVGKKMSVKRRPYLLTYKKGSKYCLVSNGTAPCLEENDFH